MTDTDLVLVHEGRQVEETSPVPEERRRKLTALSARVGVWGIIAGLSSIALGALAPGAAFGLAGFGFLAGGLGAVGTSISRVALYWAGLSR